MNITVNKTDKAIFLHVKQEDGGDAQYVSIDHADRILWWTDNGRFFRRGFDNRVVEYRNGSNGFRMTRFSRLLQPQEAETSIKDVISLVGGRMVWESVVEDAENFCSLYGGSTVPILPPDQYLSLVLEASEGCNWNRCNFCDFYKSRSFRVKSFDEFVSHSEAVKNFFGRSLSLRTNIFIGDANMLCLPREELLKMLEFVIKDFDLEKFVDKNIFGFAEARGSQFVTVDDFRRLQERKVKRLYWGLETGDEELRHLLGKPSSVDALCSAIVASKTAGINAGVMILLGAGGSEWTDKHVANTVKVMNTLPLGKGDIVYLSKLTGSYRLGGTGAEELDDSGMEEQRRSICESFICRHDRPIIATYDVEGFIY